MKKVVFMLVIGTWAISMTSCERCSTCTVKDSDGRVIYPYPETCGRKQAIEDYKDNCEEQYGLYGYSCNCTDD